MTDSQLVLHIGAPKCGSSALQAALTRQPVLTAADGRRFRYVSLGRGAGPPRLIEGQSLRRIADTSVFGYATFPAVPRDDSTQAYFEAIDATRRRGLRGGFVPILSNEAWIGDPALFAAALAAAGNPPVDAVAFLRAPVDWLNAAYWQWGVWSQPRFERWHVPRAAPIPLATISRGGRRSPIFGCMCSRGVPTWWSASGGIWVSRWKDRGR